MYKCQDCNYQCSLNSELTKHINGMHGVKVYKCNFCGEEYKWESSLNRHMKKHEEHNGEIRLASPIPNKNHFGSGYNVDNIHRVFDIRLKENFKLFLSGPSRCGKTVFVAKLIENIQSFAKQPPTSIIYVYKVW